MLAQLPPDPSARDGKQRSSRQAIKALVSSAWQEVSSQRFLGRCHPVQFIAMIQKGASSHVICTVKCIFNESKLLLPRALRREPPGKQREPRALKHITAPEPKPRTKAQTQALRAS